MHLNIGLNFSLRGGCTRLEIHILMVAGWFINKNLENKKSINTEK